jgi:hypothetical protein
MTPDTLLASFTEEERVALEAARKAEDNDAITALVRAVAARVGADEKVFGALLGKLRVRKTVVQRPIDELVRGLPYPLGWKLGILLREARRFDGGELSPQLPFDLFALTSALLRLSSVLLVQSYVARGGADAEINRQIVETLGQSLVDEKWRDLARFMAKKLASRADATELDKAMNAALAGAPVAKERRAPGVGDKDAKDVDYLIALRNKVAHGERIDPAYVRRAVDVVGDVLRRFEALTAYRLVVRTAAAGYALEGEVPRPIEGLDASLPLDEPCLLPREGAGTPLSLSPLMRFRAATGEVTLDELFFLNAGTLERLSYVGFRLPDALDAKSLGSYEAFREMMKKIPAPALPENPRLDFTQLAAESTRFFVGREDVLGALAEAVRTRPAHYAVVKALPGMGKTSLLARLYQAHPPAPARAAEGEAPRGDRWCFHFCGNVDGRNSPVVMMRSLMTQAADAVRMPQEERGTYLKSTDLKELRDEHFPALLARVASKLAEGERLVLAIDALDEGFGGEDPIASALPRVLPENAIAIVSWRVDESGRNARVDDAFQQVAAESRHAIAGADPLRGLTQENVADFIARVRHALAAGRADEQPDTLADANTDGADTQAAAQAGAAPEELPIEAFAPRPEVLDAVWRAAHTPTGADPFYLRFLAQGAETGAVDLERAESVPSSLDDAFEESWLALPTDHDFALHRLLIYLGILREPGTDALLADLLTRERPDAKVSPDDVAALRIAAGKLLVYDRDRYSLFHDRFRRFLVGEQKDPLDVALGQAAQ